MIVQNSPTLDVKAMLSFGDISHSPSKRFLLILLTEPSIRALFFDFNCCISNHGIKFDNDFYERILARAEMRLILRQLRSKMAIIAMDSQDAEFFDPELQTLKNTIEIMCSMIYKILNTVEDALGVKEEYMFSSQETKSTEEKKEDCERNFKYLSIRSDLREELKYKFYLDQLLYLKRLSFDLRIS